MLAATWYEDTGLGWAEAQWDISPFSSCKLRGQLYPRQCHGGFTKCIGTPIFQGKVSPSWKSPWKAGNYPLLLYLLGVFFFCFLFLFVAVCVVGIVFLCVLNCVQSLKESFANVNKQG